MIKRPSDGLWAGLVVGILVVTALIHFDVKISEQKTATKSAVITTPQAGQAFAGSWNRWTTGTWTLEATHTRVLNNGQKSSNSVKEVQQGANFVDEESGSIRARINGRNYTCASASGGHISGCSDSGAALPITQLVAQEQQLVQSLVIGPQAAYEVQNAATGCFNLYLIPGSKNSQWGDKAEFCFDSTTGAITRSAFYRDAGTDFVVADSVTAKVDPADLAVPQATSN